LASPHFFAQTKPTLPKQNQTFDPEHAEGTDEKFKLAFVGRIATASCFANVSLCQSRL
jgi:hypothetical protein